jgi:hypothetical protein
MNLAPSISESYVEIADVRLASGKHYRGKILSTAEKGSKFLATIVEIYEEDLGVWRRLDASHPKVGRLGINWTLVPTLEVADGVYLSRDGGSLVVVSVPVSLWEKNGAHCFPEPVPVPKLF